MKYYVPGSPDLNVWVYNEDKTLTYLSGKVQRMARILEHQKVHVGDGASSGNFRKGDDVTDKGKNSSAKGT